MNGLINSLTLSVLLGVSFLLFAVSILIRIKPKKIKLAEQIQYDPEKSALENLLREIENANSVANQDGDLSWFERKERELTHSNTGISFPVYMFILILSMVLIYAGVTAIMGLFWVGIPFALIGFLIPEAFVKGRVRKNVDKFNTEFVKALRRMASVIRSGGSLKQALADVARSRSMPEIVRIEFTKVLKDVEFGLTIEEALYKLYERIGSLDVKFLAIAVEIQRQTGGNIAQIFDSIAQTISNRFLTQADVRSTLAQAKGTSMILSVMPFGLAGLLQVINPGHFNSMFESLMGRTILLVCIGMIVFGGILMNKMSNLKI
jgi:tight adherence protein B